jgi:hypothetical protein
MPAGVEAVAAARVRPVAPSKAVACNNRNQSVGARERDGAVAGIAGQFRHIRARSHKPVRVDQVSGSNSRSDIHETRTGVEFREGRIRGLRRRHSEKRLRVVAVRPGRDDMWCQD